MSEADISSTSLANDNDSKNRSFHKAFRKKGIPSDEFVIDRYSCALQRDLLLLQGFLYVTQNYFCYYSNVVGFIHQVVIPLSKVKCILKKNAALIVPNAIQIDTKTGESYFMLSFINRDAVYTQLTSLWESYKKKHRASLVVKKSILESDKSFGGLKLQRAANLSKSYDGNLNEKKSDINKQKNAKFNEDDINKNDNEDDEVKKSKLSKYRRVNSTPVISPDSSPKLNELVHTSTVNLKDKKYSNSSKKNYHHSSYSKNHMTKNENNLNENDPWDEDEIVQNVVIFPKYIPKISSMKEYQFVKIFLVIAIIIITLSIYIQLKAFSLSKELKRIQEKSVLSLNDPSFDFSSLIDTYNNSNDNNNNSIIIIIIRNKK